MVNSGQPEGVTHRQAVEIKVPHGARIRKSLDSVDYADAYSIDVDVGAPSDIDALFKKLLRSSPAWVESLMHFRDGVVTIVGLKTNAGNNRNLPIECGSAPLSVGDKIGIFRITELFPDEIIFGENDRHLDFRVSLKCQQTEGAKTVSLATVVKFNNVLGRIYFLPVRPFHKRVVVAMLENLGR